MTLLCRTECRRERREVGMLSEVAARAQGGARNSQLGKRSATCIRVLRSETAELRITPQLCAEQTEPSEEIHSNNHSEIMVAKCDVIVTIVKEIFI